MKLSPGAELKTEDFSEEDPRDINDSLILDTPESPLADAVANVLTMTLLKKAQLKSTVMPQVQQYAWDKAANSNQPLAHTVLLLNSGGDATQAAAILSGLTAEQSTIERALALNWLAKYMATMPPVVLPAPAGAWAKHKLTGGGESGVGFGQGVPDITLLLVTNYRRKMCRSAGVKRQKRLNKVTFR